MADNLARAEAEFEAGRFDGALEILKDLLAVPGDERPLMLLGRTLERINLKAEAIEPYLRAAQLGSNPRHALARAARLSLETGRDADAMTLAGDLRRRFPGDPDAAFVIASLALRQGNEALAHSVRNDLVESDDPDVLLFAINLIAHELLNERNLTLFAKLRAHFPQDPCIRMALLAYARDFCAYDILRAEEASLRADLAAGDYSALSGESPHYALMWLSDDRLIRLAANIGPIPAPSADSGRRRWAMPHQWSDRLRIGYVSSDFWDDHATMRLMQSVLMAHDRERFDITLYCATPENRLVFDRGNRQKWGRIVSIGKLDDASAANVIRRDGIDILVDLKGHTENSRSPLMNLPVAPVHVAWLGFPGSVINIDCDYVIGDHYVLPDSSKPFYHEKFCRLPDSYQPNDPFYRPLPPATPRNALGLPQDRFVFAAFHSQRKNSLESIGMWADVLRANPTSLLWLMCEGNSARRWTAEEFRRQGIKAGQLIFAPKTAYAGHIARAQAADLCLDSFPCNGHTTTSDMLWAGLPVATIRGSHFASRVSESLLNAIGVPELVAADRNGLVELCTGLVEDRERLASLRARIADNRFRSPLFDAERFCRHLEAAFSMMAARARKGLPPDHFDVPALPPRVQPFRA